MQTKSLGWIAVTLAAAGVLALTLAGCDLKSPANVDQKRLAAADSEPGNWMSHGRTWSEQRFSPLDKVNTDTVKSLGLAWTYQLATNRGVEVTPIVVDGTMYVTSAWSVVYALNAKTGELLWKYDPNVDRAIGKYACCDVVNRGVAVWKGKVYAAALDGRLSALDARTGKPVWTVQTTDAHLPYTITGAPRVFKDKVVIGNGGSEYGVRGYVSAYDTETGKQVWRFYVTPGDPSKPQENKALEMAVKSWSGDWFKQGGGGGSPWDSMSYDPDQNLLIFGTGNGTPWDQKKRSNGQGDNLFLSSIVAVDADTGEYKWHYQTTPGDDWDFDSTQTLIQADLTIDGKPRKVVMQAAKNGYFYVIDRTSGKLIGANNFVTVTWSKGIDLKTGRPIEIGDPRYKTQAMSLVMPSGFGGHNWHPMAFSPKTGLAYIPAQEVPSVYGSDPNYVYKNGEWNVAQNPALNTLPDDPKARAAMKNALRGKLIAWDPVAGKEAWHADHTGPWNGGVLATGGGLVFQGTIDGRFNAYDASKGSLLWSTDVYTAALAGPMTYEVDGEQYVAVGAGFGTLFYIIGGFAIDHLGVPENGRILVYKIGGKAELPKPVLTPQPQPKPPAATAAADMVAAGKMKYQTYCIFCHGYNAIGAGVIPDLRYSSLLGDADGFKGVVLRGERKSNGMVSFASVLSDKDADAVRAYLITEANTAWATKHPAQAAKAH